MSIKKVHKTGKLALMSVIAIVAGVFTSMKVSESGFHLDNLLTADIANADFIGGGSAGTTSGGTGGDSGSAGDSGDSSGDGA
jgi:hypothetical protein